MENPPWLVSAPNDIHATAKTSNSIAATKKQLERTDAKLVFVNYTNPEEELRDRDKKRLVAKWSVVNTQPRHASRFKPVVDPKTILDASSTDPFASLPYALGRREWKLLYYWLDSASFGVVSPAVKDQLSQLRKTVSLPERLKSKPGMAANFALVETMLPNRTSDLTVAVAPYLNTAISALNKSLSEMQTGPPVSVLHCIAVLMTVALRTGDITSLRTHIFGMALVVSRHPTFLMSSDCIDLAICWAFAYTETPQLPTRPALLDFDIQNCSIPLTHQAGIGFEQLRCKHLISDQLCKHIAPLLGLRPLAEKVRDYKATVEDAEEMLRCAWTCMLSLKNSKGQSRSPFERALRCCLVMHVAQELMGDARRVCQHWSEQFYLHFRRISLDSLIDSAPEAVMWMMLLTGPHSDGTARSKSLQLVRSLMNRLQQQSQLDPRSHYLALQTCEQFLWSRQQDTRVDKFLKEAADSTARDAETLRFMPFESNQQTAQNERRQKPMNCAFCGRSICRSILGGVWAAPGAHYYRMCDFEWIDPEDTPDLESSKERLPPGRADGDMDTQQP